MSRRPSSGRPGSRNPPPLGVRAARCRPAPFSSAILAAAAAQLFASSLGAAPLAQKAPPAADSQQTRFPAPGEQLPVVRRTLANGMTFLFLERRQSPTVAFVVHYPVGSANERPGRTGTAHMLEHLLFKGSREIGTRNWPAELVLMNKIDQTRDSLLAEIDARFPDSARAQRLEISIAKLEDEARIHIIPNEFDQIFSSAGARSLNATTSHDATRYFVELPANRAELWFALESDRAANPVFREFFTELAVVREERRMRLEASPGGVIEAALLAAAFQEHPYGIPVAGRASDLDRLSRPRVEDFHRAHYGAQNAVVAVVGDVDATQAASWAEEYFREIPAGPPAPPAPMPEPEQTRERRVVVEFDAEPRLAVAWKAPPQSHADAPALSVLAAVLTGGRTTRLYRRLVAGDRSALHVSARLGPGSAHPGLFIVSAVPRAPHAPADLEHAVYEEIDRLKAAPPEPAALAKIRNQLNAGEYRRLSSNLELALQLAESEAMLGDWRRTFRWSGRIGRVAPADVQRVAARYLVESRRTVATMVRKRPS